MLRGFTFFVEPVVAHAERAGCSACADICVGCGYIIRVAGISFPCMVALEKPVKCGECGTSWLIPARFLSEDAAKLAIDSMRDEYQCAHRNRKAFKKQVISILPDATGHLATLHFPPPS